MQTLSQLLPLGWFSSLARAMRSSFSPRRHIASWFEATAQEQASLIEGIDISKRANQRLHQPDGFNIGINIGKAAGQTVPHLHVHVISRYAGDIEDPQGRCSARIPRKR